MREVVFLMIFISLSVVPVAAVVPVRTPEAQLGPTETPAGLDDFLEARRLELEGKPSAALKLYATALEVASDVEEIRVEEANLMLDLGMAEQAAMLLQDQEGLDWYGLRVRALALAQVSASKPERRSEAKTALEAVLKERADDPNVQYALVRVLEASGELEEALGALSDLRNALGKNPRLAALEGRILSQIGRSSEALRAFRECADTDVSCRRGLVQSLIALGRLGEAGEEMLQGLAPDDLDRMMQAAALLADGKRPQRALGVVEKVLQAQPDSPEANRFKAILLLRMGRVRQAAPLLDLLLKKDPDSSELLLARAQVYASLVPPSMEKARRDLGRAWNTVSGDAASEAATDVALAAARIELGAEHPSVAREWLDRVVDPNAGGGDYLYLLAESYRKSGQFKAGVGALIRIEPKIDEQLRPLALVLEADLGYRASMTGALDRLQPLLDTGDRRAALMALSELQSLELWARTETESRKLLTRFPNDRDILFSLAIALERQGEFEKSVDVFEDLLKSHPDDAGAANYLGYMLADADRDLEHALELVKKAVLSDPENGAYLDSMGWVLYRLGEPEKAEIWLKKAMSLSPSSSADILGHLGEVQIRLGRIEEGLSLLRRALDLGCEHPERVRALILENSTGGSGELK